MSKALLNCLLESLPDTVVNALYVSLNTHFNPLFPPFLFPLAIVQLFLFALNHSTQRLSNHLNPSVRIISINSH